MTRVTSKSLNSTVSINRKMGSGSGIPPGQNPILYIRNLPFSTTPRDLQDMFEKFGTLRQIRVGNAKDTKGSAFVIFQDPVHAKTALQKMTGYAAVSYTHLDVYKRQRHR